MQAISRINNEHRAKLEYIDSVDNAGSNILSQLLTTLQEVE